MKWREILLRFAALVSGILIAIVASAEVGVNIYSSAMKERFNYTQSEVELSSSLMNVGANFALPAGIIYDAFGGRCVISIGLGLGIVGYGLIWLSTMFQAVFAQLSGLVAFFHFIAGTGLVFLFLTAVVVNINNFTVHHRSKVSSVLNGVNVGGSAILAVIYDTYFSQGHITDPGNQKFEYFIGFIVVTFATLGILALFTLRTYPIDDTDAPYLTINDKSSIDGKPVDFPESLYSSESTDVDDYLHENNSKVITNEGILRSLLDISKKPNIQLSFWMLFFMQSIAVSVSMNTVAFTRALGFEEHILFMTSPLLVISTVGVFLICVISDFLHSRFYVRFSICIFALNLAMLLAQILIGLCMQNFIWLAIGCCVTITTGQASLSLIPSLLSNYLGVENLARSFGSFLLLFTVGYICLQRSYGAMFDSYRDAADGGTCAGPDCLIWIFMLNCILSSISVILNVVLIAMKY